MRKRRIEERNEVKDQPKKKKRKSKSNHSMTGTRFNDIHVEGGKESNNMINRRLSYLFTLYHLELPF
jgi:hypothetical protein